MSMHVSSPASAHQRRRGTLTYSAAQIPPAANHNHRALGADRTQESHKFEELHKYQCPLTNFFNYYLSIAIFQRILNWIWDIYVLFGARPKKDWRVTWEKKIVLTLWHL